MTGAGELFAGGAVGLLVTELYKGIEKLIFKSMEFKPHLKKIISTLNSLKPLIEQIEIQNNKLNLSDTVIENLKNTISEGKDRVDNIWKKAGKWNLKKARYTDQLRELDESLKGQLKILNAEGIRDTKEILGLGRKLDNQVDELVESARDGMMTGTKILVTVNSLEEQVKGIKLDVEEWKKKESTVVVVQNQIDQIQGWCAVPEPPPVTVGLDVPLRELKNKFLKDDDVKMLVVTAPGGCGKTTLATMFCQDGDVKDKFKKNIFFVAVSKKSNLDLIVQELYQSIGFQAPTFRNEVNAVTWLEQFPNKAGLPLLLVLDDVWPKSKSLLQKFEELKMPDFKILVTSRSEFPGFGYPYHLNLLNDKDGMTLFHHSASLGDRSSYVREDLSSEIVQRCKGFPLAITVVGTSLRGEPIEIWQERIDEWSEGTSILESEDKLLHCLQSSIDALDKLDCLRSRIAGRIKECFIDLGSFPEDQRIPAAALIDMWSELYGLVKERMSIVNLYKLTQRSLANLVVTRKERGQMDDYYSEHFVTQHDIIRELAIHQTNNEPIEQRKRLIIDIRGDNLPNWWIEQKYQPIKAHLVSISTDGEFSTNWPNMELPEAEVLVLNFQTENYAIPEFVEKMKKLKVLIVTNYGFAPAELSNFQLLGSLPNLKRIRLQGISIPSISKNIPIQLKSLQKMSLFMCKIGQPFSNCSIQILDALPNLVELNIDYCNDLVELPAKLFDLKRLKKLSITHSHKLSALPEDVGKLANLEVLRLRSCTDLVMLPGSIKNLTKLNFLDISDCFSIKELPEEIGELSSLTKLNMRQCSRLKELPVSLLYIEQLQEVVCDEDTKNLWDPFNPSTRNIRITVAKDNFNLDWLFKVPF